MSYCFDAFRVIVSILRKPTCSNGFAGLKPYTQPSQPVVKVNYNVIGKGEVESSILLGSTSFPILSAIYNYYCCGPPWVYVAIATSIRKTRTQLHQEIEMTADTSVLARQIMRIATSDDYHFSRRKIDKSGYEVVCCPTGRDGDKDWYYLGHYGTQSEADLAIVEFKIKYIEEAIRDAECGKPEVPEGFALISNEMLEFLQGGAPLEGVWFGEKHPTEKSAFWWRKYLPIPKQEKQDE